MSEQRIERFVNVYRSSLGDTYDSREGADHAAGLLRLRVAQCVEIRDGEPHPDDVGMMLADAKLRSDAATERAEKAEQQVAGLPDLANKLGMEAMAQERERLNGIISGLRGQIQWLIEEHLRECDELRGAQNDAAAKFERWAAVRFRAVVLASLDGQFNELDEARRMRSLYFPPAKEA